MKKYAVLLAVMFLSCANLYAGHKKLNLNNLTLEQIIGQTLVVRVDVGEEDKYEQAVKDGLIGAVLIKRTGGYQAGEADVKRAETLAVVSKLREWEKQSPHKIPMLIAFDYEGGAVVSPMFLGLKQLPSNMLMSAGGNKEDIYNMFRQSGKEIKAMGGQISFAPDFDVNTNPKNPIIGTRSFGSDAKTVGKNGAQALKGLQKEGVAAFAKHFPGHGDTVTDSHLDKPVMDMPYNELWRQHIAAFKTAVDNGVWGIMSSHVVYPALDDKYSSTFSHKILTDLLRGKLKFKGVVATDSLDMEGAKMEHGIPQAVTEAYAAGADMPLIGKELPYDTVTYVKEQIANGSLSEKNIRASAQRVIDLKNKTGLYKSTRSAKGPKSFNKYARKIAKEGVVLVKNENKIVPIKNKGGLCTIFFSEPILANQISEIETPFKQSGWEVKSVRSEQIPTEETLQAALECAKSKDLVIIGSTQKYSAPEEMQKKIIDSVLEQNPNAVLISVLSPYDIKDYPQAKTVLAVFGPTAFAMQSAGQIILGQIPPKGVMPTKL